MRTRGHFMLSEWVLLSFLAAVPATAQSNGGVIDRAPNDMSSPSAPMIPLHPAYGTTSSSLLSINPCDGASRDPIYPVRASNCDWIEPTTAGVYGSAGFPIHLPTGSLITSITIYYFDNDPVSDPGVSLQRVDGNGNLTLVQELSPGVFSGGNASSTASFTHQIDNAAGSYAILAILTRTASTTMAIHKIEIYYKLQVSPAPATATFSDVPVGSPLFRFVEALVASGITAGCGGGNFCPNQAVTRGQLAVFLASALGMHFPN